ncbi:MAG TPA: hypothetical protein VM010_09040, partial [Chitinophagaceae bacterium]|nr:hypothetical protein [Chitinophagaceae bacterium]
RLTPKLLAGLYGNVLIETEAKASPAVAEKMVGGNKKNILILVRNEGGEMIPQTELSFLTSVLTACKLSLDDVTILNHATRMDKDYKDLLHRFESRFILLFDVTPLQFGLPMDFPPFQIQAFDTRQYLLAPTLSKIEAHKGLKGELWNALKKLFML